MPPPLRVVHLPQSLMAVPTLQMLLHKHPILIDIASQKAHILGVLQIDHILVLNPKLRKLFVWLEPEDELGFGLVDCGAADGLRDLVYGVDVVVLPG
jgi:hypothetical protein